MAPLSKCETNCCLQVSLEKTLLEIVDARVATTISNSHRYANLCLVCFRVNEEFVEHLLEIWWCEVVLHTGTNASDICIHVVIDRKGIFST